MPIELSDNEIETVRALIQDWGFEYSLVAEKAKVAALAKRLKMDKTAAELLS